MLANSPRFDEPNYTRDATAVLREFGGHVDVQPPLPHLFEPVNQPVVSDPRSEPLVKVEHTRIRVLDNYFHAGWSTAISGAWLRTEATQRLKQVAESLPPRWGLAIFDAWRPLDLQAELYTAAYSNPGLPEGFVAFPDPDPLRPPPHLTGGTVDLTLTFDGTPLALGTGFDGFTEAAEFAALENEPSPERELRRWLYRLMTAQGFAAMTFEWWHFEFGTRRWAGIYGCQPLYGPAQLPHS